MEQLYRHMRCGRIVQSVPVVTKDIFVWIIEETAQYELLRMFRNPHGNNLI